jgi:crotonobetainyl-CoA:carnitine CoA-transferase CaiB-like acyl-CoA transferase
VIVFVYINSDALRVQKLALNTMKVASSLEHDPQLREGELLTPIEHPVVGIFGHLPSSYKLSKTKAQIRTLPCLGEYTDYVCTQLPGMSHEEFGELLQQEVFESEKGERIKHNFKI